jgi:hypothetical protein
VNRDLSALEKRHNRKLAIKRSPELKGLTTLAHHIDLASGRLVEQAPPPGRIKVE